MNKEIYKGVLVNGETYYTKECIISLIRDIQQCLFPSCYHSSINLDTIDFSDVATQRVIDFGFTEEEVFLSDPNYRSVIE